ELVIEVFTSCRFLESSNQDNHSSKYGRDVSISSNNLFASRIESIRNVISSSTSWINILSPSIRVYKLNNSNQILTALAKIRAAKIHCKYLVFIFLPTLAPSGAPIILAITIIIAGINNTWPVAILPAAVPIEEMKVIASELAIVILVGIFNTTIIIGTKTNAPAAPTIPEATPTISARIDASGLLNVTSDKSVTPSSFDFGRNIITTAIVAKIA